MTTEKISLYLYPGLITNFSNKFKNHLTIGAVCIGVTRYYRLPIERLFENSRKEEVKNVRQLVMYMMRHLLGMSYSAIAKFFNKDHTTVIHACKTVKGYLQVYSNFAKEYEEIKENTKNITSETIRRLPHPILNRIAEYEAIEKEKHRKRA